MSYRRLWKPRTCICGVRISGRRDKVYCSPACKQAAFRLKVKRERARLRKERARARAPAGTVTN